MISIATDNVDRKDVVEPKSFAVRELILMATILGLVSTGFDFMTFGIFRQFGETSLQTYWFMSSILTELVLIYSIRTRGWAFKVKNMPSKVVLVLTVVAGILTVAIPFTSFGTEVFKFLVPTSDKLLIILAIVVGYFVSTEIVKKMYFKYLNFSR
jgi:Mg2+-importing ATPase